MLRNGKLKDSEIISVLEKHASHPSANLALNTETCCFTSKEIDGFIAYRFSGKRYIVLVSGIHSSLEDKEDLLKQFILWANQISRIIVAVQINCEDALLFSRHGFKINQLGASFTLNLENYSLSGTFFMKLRNKISRAKRAGVQVVEYGKELSFYPELRHQLLEIDNDWIKSKHAKKLDFMVGETGDIESFDFTCKRLFIAMYDGKPAAYILYVRTFGTYAGWMHELTRKKSDAVAGIMELINSIAIQTFINENVRYLNFGFTPLTELNPDNEIKSAYSPVMQWVFKLLAKHGRFIYPSKSQLQYKLKWAPDIIFPEYIAFGSSAIAGGLWSFLKLVKAI